MALAMLLCLADFAVVYAWVMENLNGPALGRYVTQVAARSNLRGRIEVASVTWSGRAVYDLIRNRPHPVEVQGLKVYDPDGLLVVNVPRARVGVNLEQALRKRYYLSDLDLPEALVVLLEKKDAAGKGELGLVAALQPRVQTKPSKSTGKPGPVVVIRNARIGALDFGLSFTGPKGEPDGGWGLALHRFATGLDLRLDARGLRGAPKVDLAFTFWNARAAEGELRIGTTVYPLADLDFKLLTLRQGKRDLEFDVALQAAGAAVRGQGAITSMVSADAGIVCGVKLTGAGNALRLAVGPIYGGPVKGDFDIRGRFKDGPIITGDLEDVAATVGPLKGTGFKVHLFLASRKLKLDPIAGHLASGRVKGSVVFDYAARQWTARATVSDVDTGAIVEPSQRRLLSGRLGGGAVVVAGMQSGAPVRINDIDFTLRRRFGKPLPRALRLRGAVTVRNETVDLRHVEVTGEGAVLTAQGRVHTRRQDLDLAVKVAAQRAAALLGALGLPPLAESFTATADVTGRIENPTLKGTLSAAGVGLPGQRLESLNARLGLRDGTVGLDELRAVGYGGSATGRASLQLFRRSLRRMLRDPVLQATLGVKHVRLERLLGLTDVRATLDGSVEVAGPLSAPVGRASLSSDDLVAYGDRYAEVAAELEAQNRLVYARRVVMRRQAGGDLRVTGNVGLDGTLALDVLATRFPLQAIPRVPDLPFAVVGLLTGQLHLGGDLKRPSVGGVVTLLGMRLRNILLGNGTLKLEPGGDAVRVTGSFFDRVDVDGYLTLAPRPALFVKINLRRMPLESLVPELMLIDTRGLISGTVQLSITQDGLKDAQLRLTELSVVMERRRETEEEQRRFELRNRGPVALGYRDERIEFEQVNLTSAAGDLEVRGFVGTRDSDAHVRGSLGLELLEYLARNLVDHTHGDVVLDLGIRGPLARPRLSGTVEVRKASITPRESDRAVTVPSARFELSPTAVVIRSARLELDGAGLDVVGRVGLSDFKPTDIDARVTGALAARALQLALPKYFSEATGAFGLELAVRGPLAGPRLAGRLQPRAVDLLPRGLGREVSLKAGALEVSGTPADLRVRARALRGSLDEGELTLDGTLALHDFALADIDMRFVGMGIPHRSPRVYEVSVNTELRLTMDATQRLALAGTVDLVDGRYVQRFDLLKGVIEPSRTYVEAKPFWQGVKLLEEMSLALQVRTTGAVFVRNNLADIGLDVALEVRGTLPDPRLVGDIRTIEGAFSIPFLRGRFQVQEGGTISFDPAKEIPKETPRVFIVGETVYVDSREQEHLITLTLDGPLGQLRFDLNSNTGLGRAQCLALLSTGRTTEEVRAMVSGRPEAGGQQSPGAVAAADQALKTITSDFMSLLVEDPLKKVLKLDLARLEFGTESFEVRLGWRLGRHVRLLGSHELGLLGDSHTDGKAELKISDHLLVVPEVERMVRGQQTEQETILRGKVQLKLRLILR